jgi:hypothetical protein
MQNPNIKHYLGLLQEGLLPNYYQAQPRYRQFGLGQKKSQNIGMWWQRCRMSTVV